MKLIVVPLIAIAGAVALGQSGGTPAPSRWNSLRFLIGDWTGMGGGQPGSSTGAYSFHTDLKDHVLVRRSFADVTDAKGARSRHEDLLIVYGASSGEPDRAIYFDSEDHVINYRVTAFAQGTAVFESEPGQPGPRYRLTYTAAGQNLDGKFEVAAPGAPEFKTYLRWTSAPASRKK